ncbi:putative transcription factor [Methanofollis sp. W23]|uniref:multiprotein bridging factor aMBF1 n=1 Tax=Methanofollis sp. W23 TaxID=2817849 RepID=UPI001AE49142|nr:multiprotein bridging factor aMBF1 [Methanofollis sp. W23]MBP2145543.1 putative transcription factor [Methanofollis sp. W23]
MQCELCGAVVRGAPKKVQIEGAVLQVCEKCARLGVEIAPPRPVATRRRAQTGARPKAAARPQQHRGRDVFDMMVGEIVEDFGDRIKKARLEKNWTQKDLANEIKEREILIKKIEKGDLIPEDDVRVKIEKALGIKLLDVSDDDLKSRGPAHVSTTVGDIIKIKRE